MIRWQTLLGRMTLSPTRLRRAAQRVKAARNRAARTGADADQCFRGLSARELVHLMGAGALLHVGAAKREEVEREILKIGEER